MLVGVDYKQCLAPWTESGTYIEYPTLYRLLPVGYPGQTRFSEVQALHGDRARVLITSVPSVVSRGERLDGVETSCRGGSRAAGFDHCSALHRREGEESNYNDGQCHHSKVHFLTSFLCESHPAQRAGAIEPPFCRSAFPLNPIQD